MIGLKRIAFCLLFLATAWVVLPARAQSEKVDNELMQTLKTEARAEELRRGQFKTDRDSKKVFDDEREKGLALFLEQQEKWDLMREKGLAEHRKQKKEASPVEGGPEYLADEKQKKADALVMEKARQMTVRTRQSVQNEMQKKDIADESEELGLNVNRPRFDLRKRGQNKWVKGNSKFGSGSGAHSSSGSSGSSAPPPLFDDFPPQPDYAPAPVPMENYEDIPPPPPPPMNFDGGMNNASPYGIDSGFGDVPPPPPPPPPMDYDF